MKKRKKRRKFKRQTYPTYMHLDLEITLPEQREGAVKSIEDYLRQFYDDGILHINKQYVDSKLVWFNIGFRSHNRFPDRSIALMFEPDHPHFEEIHKHQAFLYDRAKTLLGKTLDFSEIPELAQEDRVFNVVMGWVDIKTTLLRLPRSTFPADMQAFIDSAHTFPIVEDPYPIWHWFHSVMDNLEEAGYSLSVKEKGGFLPLADKDKHSFKHMPPPLVREPQHFEGRETP